MEAFSLGSFSSSDALFDLEKLLWLSKEHMRAMDPGRLAERMGLPEADREKVAILRENARTLHEMRSMLAMFDRADVEEEGMRYLLSLKETGYVDASGRDSRRRPREFEGLFKKLKKGAPFRGGSSSWSSDRDQRQEERPAPERTLPVHPKGYYIEEDRMAGEKVFTPSRA